MIEHSVDFEWELYSIDVAELMLSAATHEGMSRNSICVPNTMAWSSKGSSNVLKGGPM